MNLNTIREENRIKLNMELLNLIIGGVTYDYGNYKVEIPDGETEPYNQAVRMFATGFIAAIKRHGKTFEQTMTAALKQNRLSNGVITYYRDKTILK